ncbi:MAG TPA: hypothetical protein VK978_00650 [Candidatus Saccharimonadales bacterium]|nr:hypothetical protein [Candidatus Saccharimonadales bacterium]
MKHISLKRLPGNRILIIVLGAVILTSAVAFAAPRLQNASSVNRMQPAIPADSSKTTIAPERSAGNEPAQTGGSTAQTSASQGTAMPPTASTNAANPVPAAGTDASCGNKLHGLVRGYERETGRKKADLDSKISFMPPGASIISGYVGDYNQEATHILRQYTEKAARMSCTFPVKAPALLPSDYLPAGL